VVEEKIKVCAIVRRINTRPKKDKKNAIQ